MNGLAAGLYQYNTYAVQGISLADGTNVLTVIAQDTLWRRSTNTVTAYWPATATFQYDQNGSLVWDGKERLDYDADNQLITVTFTNAVQSKFVYDGLNRLRIRREYAWQTNQWKLTNEVRYVYDHNLVIQERDSNNVPKVTYTRGLDLSVSFEGAGGIGGLLAFTQNGSTNQHFYYDDDGAGNVTGLFDTNLNQVGDYLYDPFGNTIFASGPMAGVNLYRFSSKEYLGSVGGYEFGRRIYSPNLGRWLSQDPIGELGGANLYRFVHNRPVNAVDPYGDTEHNTVAQVSFNVPPDFAGPISYYNPPRRLVLYPDGSIDELRNPGVPVGGIQSLDVQYLQLFLAAQGLAALTRAMVDAGAAELPQALENAVPRARCPPTIAKMTPQSTTSAADLLQLERRALEAALREDQIAVQNARDLIARIRNAGGEPNPHGLLQDLESFQTGVVAKQQRLDMIAKELKDLAQ